MKPFTVFCLCVQGEPLSPQGWLEIYRVAWKLFQSDKIKSSFHGPGIRGIVSTNYEEASLGTLSGVQFYIEYSSLEGERLVDRKVTFAVSEGALKAEIDDWSQVELIKLELRLQNSVYN